jgi:hypothetical protein
MWKLMQDNRTLLEQVCREELSSDQAGGNSP